MTNVGVARAIVNPPLTIEQWVWGAKSHVTPRGIESDFWATCLVLAEGDATAVLIDLDLCTIAEDRADRIRTGVAAALEIDSGQVRVSVTHTHAGPVLRADHHAPNAEAERTYLDFLVEQCISTAVQASRDRVPVSVHPGYGSSAVGKSRRQRLDDGLMVAGYNPEGAADPTVSVIGFHDADGAVVASIVHYAAHPTTLGYTNDILSPDYPGVTKRFVEQTIGGHCIFLQGAAGNVGPGPGGFLSDFDLMHSIGTQLGCAASQTLLAGAEQQYDHSYQQLVRSGADLGVWSRTLRPPAAAPLQVRSERITLPVQDQPPPAEVERQTDELADLVTRLKSEEAPEADLGDARFRLRRSTMALSRSRQFHGKQNHDVEVHVIAIGAAVLIGIPIEPFCEIGTTIREQSPFPYTLFSGYTNGAYGYLPTPQAAAVGGYEVDQMAFRHDAADLLTERILQILNEIAPTSTTEIG